ncbi:MAG TPA: carbohydrate kinase family protein [Verrucomicrobiae bacterium]|nr:carbohydrate kinase family protein [Verrucomicrobiae bacterium]
MKTRSTPRRGVMAGGNWLVDYVKVVDTYPQPEQLANILSQYQGTGGAAYNVLMALARSGAPFPLLGAGLVGNDRLGKQILQDCRRHQIDARHLRSTSRASTSFTDVMTERSAGRRTFFHCRGANALWRGDDLDFDHIGARIFHFGYLLLLDEMDKPDGRFGTRAARLLAKARKAGVKTSVDAASVDSPAFAEVIAPALKHADYCILNEFEAGKITGICCRDGQGRPDVNALSRSARALLELGVRELVVVHYPEGSLAARAGGERAWQPSVRLPPTRIAGTAGAGDAFCAGMLLGLHENWELQRCLRAAACVAAASLSHPTTTGGIGSLRRSLAIGKKFGFRRSS